MKIYAISLSKEVPPPLPTPKKWACYDLNISHPVSDIDLHEVPDASPKGDTGRRVDRNVDPAAQLPGAAEARRGQPLPNVILAEVKEDPEGEAAQVAEHAGQLAAQLVLGAAGRRVRGVHLSIGSVRLHKVRYNRCIVTL